MHFLLKCLWNFYLSLGVKLGSTRTTEQTQIAYFWAESLPLVWNRIARAVSASEGLDLWENTRLFGLLNMAMADGYIGTFEAKYHYNYWRPVTAIQLADTDGNPYTIADPAWEPLLPTPPVPDYDSGHSVEGGAAAYVLKGFFKDDDISFTACNLTLPVVEERCGGTSEVRRSFTSFTQAAEENGLSLIYNDFIFAMRLTRALITAARSPIARSATFCSRCGNSRKDKRMGQRLYRFILPS